MQVRLRGCFPKDLVANGKKVIRLDAPRAARAVADAAQWVEVANARRLQVDAESVAAFFDPHGFALLHHDSAVKEWDATGPFPADRSPASIIRRWRR